MIDISNEIKFHTARSSGSGGQNVNKVETMAEGRFHIASSVWLSKEQKETLALKLAAKINKEGFLLVRSQVSRSQLVNKEEVIKKMNRLICEALHKKKVRKTSQPTLASKEKRIRMKKEKGIIKSGRKRISPSHD